MKKIDWNELELKEGIKNKKINIFEIIERKTRENKNQIALYFQSENGREKIINYPDLIIEVNKFSNLLKEKGIRKSQRVALFLPKVFEMYVGFLAAIKIGAIAVPLFEAFQADGLELRLKRGEVNMLITNKELYGRLKDKNLKKKMKTLIIDSDNFKKEIEKQDEECETLLVDKKDTCMMIFTSSTAGTPVAGIMIPHNGAVQWIYTGKEILQLSNESKYWCTAHPAWVTGAVYGIISPLLIGASIYVLEGRFDVDLWLRFLKEKEITNVYTAPTVLRLLKDKISKNDFEKVISICSVGEALPQSITDFYKIKAGVKIIDTYWQTETGAIVIANIDFKNKSLGKSIGVNAVSRKGMIMIEKSWPSMMTGIYKHEKMYKSYFEGKWFKTNDLAEKKQENFYFQGRKDDIIKTSGERVSPLEIENVLLKHSSVREAAVIGVPDKIRGSIIKAFIVLRKGVLESDKLKEEIGEFVKKNYAGHAYPKIVEFLKELPKTNSGKIIRMKLKERKS